MVEPLRWPRRAERAVSIGAPRCLSNGIIVAPVLESAVVLTT